MVTKKPRLMRTRILLDWAEQIARAKGTTLEEEVWPWLNDLGSEEWKLPKQN
jgi:hypothetical protein